MTNKHDTRSLLSVKELRTRAITLIASGIKSDPLAWFADPLGREGLSAARALWDIESDLGLREPEEEYIGMVRRIGLIAMAAFEDSNRVEEPWLTMLVTNAITERYGMSPQGEAL